MFTKYFIKFNGKCEILMLFKLKKKSYNIGFSFVQTLMGLKKSHIFIPETQFSQLVMYFKGEKIRSSLQKRNACTGGKKASFFCINKIIVMSFRYLVNSPKQQFFSQVNASRFHNPCIIFRLVLSFCLKFSTFMNNFMKEVYV